jgi:phosphatidylglycerol---prolipoprotein diacylglyceryl transferase
MPLDFLPAVIAYPSIDPVLVEIGPFAIRWYALAYVVGLIAGWRYVVGLARRFRVGIPPATVDDLLVWATLGVILGGRLGYVLFYNLPYYAANPMHALAVWQGGMAFHGGLAGVMVAMALFARRRGLPLLSLADLVAAAAPIGLFFGRLANFINGELYGRTTDVAWAMVFPRGGPEPRHPSQLYEAALEGLVLFVVLAVMVWRSGALARPGLVTGVFLAGYAAARILVELFREPDAQLGTLLAGATMGQLLSLPMLAAGVWLILRALRRPGIGRI